MWPQGMSRGSPTGAGSRHRTVAPLGPAAHLQRRGHTPRSGKARAGTPPPVWQEVEWSPYSLSLGEGEGSVQCGQGT